MKTSRVAAVLPVTPAPAPALPGGLTKDATRADQRMISERARAIWRERGCPSGRDEEIWLAAERELTGSGSVRESGRTGAGKGAGAATRLRRRREN